LSAGFESFRIHRTAIWGFGREGQAALKAIRERYPEKIIALIISPEEAEQWDFTTDPYLEVITSEASAGLLGQYGTIIKSPGISPYSTSCDWARFRGTRIISGTSIWFADNPHAKTICITGTKGKSTVSALVAHLLRAAGQLTALCGNIGVPLLELADANPAPDWWVIEMSSYQTADFMGVPAVACVLNLFPEHIPWHGSEERYYQDKIKILANGKADVAVLNGDDERLVAMTQFVDRGYYFNTSDSWHVKGEGVDAAIYFAEVRMLPIKDLRLKGRHNAQNVCAALMILQAAGFDAKALAKHVRSFHGLPHRLQHLGARGGFEFIDDSISTTPHASIAALESMEGPSTILVGGFDRGLGWDAFVDYVQAHPVHAVIASGANAEKIQDAFAKRMRIVAPHADQAPAPGSVAFAKLDTLDAAVDLAMRVTPRGGNILLSPGAPSFDQYQSYAERGRAFATLTGFGELSEQEISGLGVS
jgi:UDP-N-acetylmuramoyl-L-alanine---L-glutamate ligase